jgi:hypothetical protein
MSVMPAVELVLGNGRAALWIYWLVTTLTSKRSRLANATKRSDDDRLGALLCLTALTNPDNRLNGITHQVTTHPVSGGKGHGDSHARRVRRSLLAPQAE